MFNVYNENQLSWAVSIFGPSRLKSKGRLARVTTVRTGGYLRFQFERERVIGKLVQFNSEYFEGSMNEHGCGLIVSDPRPLSRLRHRLRPHLRPRLYLRLRLRPHLRSSDDWVEVLWTDGKTYWEFVDYFKEMERE